MGEGRREEGGGREEGTVKTEVEESGGRGRTCEGAGRTEEGGDTIP